MEQIVLLYGFIAEIYKQKLIDPIDKPPKLEKTCFRIIGCLSRYFKEKNRLV